MLQSSPTTDDAGRVAVDAAARGTILSVRGIGKRFSTVQAVDDLSFEVERGQVFALLGPNGAGKSTMVRMLCGILLPDEGDMAFTLDDSSAPVSAVPQQLLGYLPEERGLYGDKSILDNLLYFASLRGLDPAVAKSRAMRWLERFSLADRATEKLNGLSKGNQQKVQFVTAVLHAPRLAILDEPFSGFDPVNQDLTVNLIRELSADGITVILSAHQMDLVESLADEILLMHQGRAVLRGSVEEIRSRSATGQRLLLGFREEFDVGRLGRLEGVKEVVGSTKASARLALARGAPLEQVLGRVAEVAPLSSVQTETASLREIYLAAVGAGQ